MPSVTEIILQSRLDVQVFGQTGSNRLKPAGGVRTRSCLGQQPCLWAALPQASHVLIEALPPMSDGIIIFAHGSRIESANQAVRNVAEALAGSSAARVLPAFLELGDPDLETAASRLAGLGVTRLVIVPYFLTLGLHMERDLPRIAERIARAHKGLDIRIARPLDGHPALLQILQDRVRQTLA
jgi:hypothetical protein